ncbi:MAG: hypothetical protein P8Q90_04330 [Candidatus Thalassarchaeaceae archaeon]|jgi:hypothetical protein|nr:hypothetical protein [Candidatus Thalassarchaeaceae archaeon]
METTDVGTYAMVALTIGLLVFIWRMRMRNIADSQDDPAVAGQDILDGAAINPEQFDEPDDAALDEMQELLENAAESQGLTYEE